MWLSSRNTTTIRWPSTTPFDEDDDDDDRIVTDRKVLYLSRVNSLVTTCTRLKTGERGVRKVSLPSGRLCNFYRTARDAMKMLAICVSLPKLWRNFKLNYLPNTWFRWWKGKREATSSFSSLVAETKQLSFYFSISPPVCNWFSVTKSWSLSYVRRFRWWPKAFRPWKDRFKSETKVKQSTHNAVGLMLLLQHY